MCLLLDPIKAENKVHMHKVNESPANISFVKILIRSVISSVHFKFDFSFLVIKQFFIECLQCARQCVRRNEVVI